MRIIIEGATEEFAEKAIALAAQHGAELTITPPVQPGWTVDRAERFLRSLPGSALLFTRTVVAEDGYAEVETLRERVGKLNGPTVALAFALTRGIREGWWPEGTPSPVEKVTDTEHPASKRPTGYLMAGQDLTVFRKAFARVDTARRAARVAGLYPGGEGKTTMSWAPDSIFEKGYPDVNVVDLDGGSRPSGDEQEGQS
ncbi:hypothetical protein ACFYY1_37090 [Streptomyces sp. NPDC001890]|uniref:hypothetical protein n=1 Tax=Streptomyces sp. NPDC001890 TaxID=3364620 RepID=UPI0036BC1A33